MKAHYDSDYYQAVVASCKQEKVQAQQKYQATVEQLKKEHETALSKLSNQQEIKDEKYVHKNRLFDAKMQLDKDCQAIKDRRHAAFDYKYHLIDMLRLSSLRLASLWRKSGKTTSTHLIAVTFCCATVCTLQSLSSLLYCA